MKRIMGLDVGNKTIGVAVSDLMGLTAQGITTVRRKGIKTDLEELNKIIKEKEVGEIVVGLPKNMNGTLGPQSEKVVKFTEKLKTITDLEIKFWDERLTTVAAEKSLIQADVSRQKEKVIDMLAAVLILQGYLDMKRNI